MFSLKKERVLIRLLANLWPLIAQNYINCPNLVLSSGCPRRQVLASRLALLFCLQKLCLSFLSNRIYHLKKESESLTPLSPTMVFIPSSISATNSQAPAVTSAIFTSLSLASRAQATLSLTVPKNRNGSWLTNPIRERTECIVNSDMSWPLILT